MGLSWWDTTGKSVLIGCCQDRDVGLARRKGVGEEAQVDYGKLGRWVDPATGKTYTVWAFAIVLCASRHMYVRPVTTMDQQAWTQAYVEAFEFFGGSPPADRPGQPQDRGG